MIAIEFIHSSECFYIMWLLSERVTHVLDFVLYDCQHINRSVDSNISTLAQESG